MCTRLQPAHRFTHARPAHLPPCLRQPPQIWLRRVLGPPASSATTLSSSNSPVANSTPGTRASGEAPTQGSKALTLVAACALGHGDASHTREDVQGNTQHSTQPSPCAPASREHEMPLRGTACAWPHGGREPGGDAGGGGVRWSAADLQPRYACSVPLMEMEAGAAATMQQQEQQQQWVLLREWESYYTKQVRTDAGWSLFSWMTLDVLD